MIRDPIVTIFIPLAFLLCMANTEGEGRGVLWESTKIKDRYCLDCRICVQKRRTQWFRKGAGQEHSLFGQLCLGSKSQVCRLQDGLGWAASLCFGVLIRQMRLIPASPQGGWELIKRPRVPKVLYPVLGSTHSISGSVGGKEAWEKELGTTYRPCAWSNFQRSISCCFKWDLWQLETQASACLHRGMPANK